MDPADVLVLSVVSCLDGIILVLLRRRSRRNQQEERMCRLVSRGIRRFANV